jgi:hypothetical protein
MKKKPNSKKVVKIKVRTKNKKNPARPIQYHAFLNEKSNNDNDTDKEDDTGNNHDSDKETNNSESKYVDPDPNSESPDDPSSTFAPTVDAPPNGPSGTPTNVVEPPKVASPTNVVEQRDDLPALEAESENDEDESKNCKNDSPTANDASPSSHANAILSENKTAPTTESVSLSVATTTNSSQTVEAITANTRRRLNLRFGEVDASHLPIIVGNSPPLQERMILYAENKSTTNTGNVFIVKIFRNT